MQSSAQPIQNQSGIVPLVGTSLSRSSLQSFLGLAQTRSYFGAASPVRVLPFKAGDPFWMSNADEGTAVPSYLLAARFRSYCFGITKCADYLEA